MNEPSLHALPGRVIVRVNDRPTTIPGSTLAADSRYYYSPYIGTILEIGDPLNEQQAVLAKELAICTAAGHRAIFTPDSGIGYTTKEMRDVVGNRTNAEGDRTSRFGWLAGLRVFRIEDFAATLVGGDALGGSDE